MCYSIPMKTLKIKSIELVIAKALNDPEQKNPRVRECFEAVLTHYADEDYLDNYAHHTQILSLIYKQQIYRKKSVDGLSLYLHIEYKRLLAFRKSYVHLFAKKYFNLTSFSEESLHRLVEQIEYT